MASARVEPRASADPPPVMGVGSSRESAPRRWAGIGDAAVLLHRVLPLGSLCALARAHGRLTYRTNRRSAAVVRANLAAFTRPGESAAALAQRFFEERHVRRLLIAVAPRLRLEELRAVCTFQNLGHLEAAAGAGHGAILLCSHLHSSGGLLSIITLRRLGYDVRISLPAAGDPWSDTQLRRLIWAVSGPEPTISELAGGFVCQFNIRPIVRVLEEGAIVAQTGDGWHSASFVDVEFLGRTVPFPTGVLSVARLTGVPVVPVFAGGRADRMRLTLEEPFHVGRGPGELEQAVAHYAARLDAHVRAEPAAWEHWTLPDALDTLAAWRERPLREKYEV